MGLFPLISEKKSGRKFLVKNVDMRWSFDSLKDLAIKKVGADFLKGDVVYFENANITRRKALLIKGEVIIMAYWMKLKGKFVELGEPEGSIKGFINFME